MIGRILGSLNSIDKLKQRFYRSRPVFDVNYLREEGPDENYVRGALKFTVRNRSDRDFTIQDIHVVTVNQEEVVQRGQIDSKEIVSHDFEDFRLDFRYRGDSLFDDVENEALISYYLEDEKRLRQKNEKLVHVDNSDIETI